MLCDPNPKGKVLRTREAVYAWRAGNLSKLGDARPPDSPARPVRPELKAPRDMPRRRKGRISGRRAFVHAIAHIEFNAIDLAWDMVARIDNHKPPRAFFDDWVGIAYDEAEHFVLLNHRLVDIDITYGDLPAHNGLWEANGDAVTAAILDKIGREEIHHVAAGVRWFEYLVAARGLYLVATFHDLVAKLFSGTITSPSMQRPGPPPVCQKPISNLTRVNEPQIVDL